MGEVVQLHNPRPADLVLGDGIRHLFQQSWPVNRSRGDFRTAIREAADMEPRVTICGRCGSESGMLSGPAGRAWFASHRCKPVAA